MKSSHTSAMKSSVSSTGHCLAVEPRDIFIPIGYFRGKLTALLFIRHRPGFADLPQFRMQAMRGRPVQGACRHYGCCRSERLT
ncbi:hypothetical protein ALC60_05012 [Trachymyrmex zeteki]|uniref:Uncharacterized protein n=1 Tax=Mycetomoellerius zeteki TaxID=64791 RepID=A0A151X6T5_9HYME|nr:hypothetical protein ALC60_05012 [Trachymyrmex zeteki]